MPAVGSVGVSSQPFLSSSQTGRFEKLLGCVVLPKSIKLIHAGSALCAGVVLRLVRGEPAVKSCGVEALRKGGQMYLSSTVGSDEVSHKSCTEFMMVFFRFIAPMQQLMGEKR